MSNTDKNTCHVLMAVDASGSMWHLADDVRGGFNQYVTDLQADKKTRYRVTAVLFNTDVRTLCEDAKLSEVPKLDTTNYAPGGGTALFDAVGDLVTSHRDNGTDRVLVFVNTDGQENSSREWQLKGIQKLVQEREATGRWGFVFIGQGPDTWMQGERMGFRSVGTQSTSGSTRGGYSGMGVATVGYAAGTASADDVAGTTKKYSDRSDEEERSGK